MGINRKLDLIAKMIEEFSDTEEIVEFLTGIAERLRKPDDVAKQRWEVGRASIEPRKLYVHCGTTDGVVLVVQESATPEQIQVMAAAPEILYELEKIQVKYVDTQQKYPSGETLHLSFHRERMSRIDTVIKKAREVK